MKGSSSQAKKNEKNSLLPILRNGTRFIAFVPFRSVPWNREVPTHTRGGGACMGWAWDETTTRRLHSMHLFMSWCFAYRRALFSLGGKRCAGQPTSQLKSLSNGPRGQYDVVVAGGGIMGCSSAYFLAQRIPGSSICVIERDPKVTMLETVH